jgi:thymidine kinase
MFSGKTKELLRLLERYQIAHKKCVMLKPRCDTRASRDDLVSSHDGGSSSPAIPVDGLEDVRNAVSGMDVVGIDEGQFLPELRAICEMLAEAGKVVVVAALSGTHNMRIWPAVADLVPVCNKVQHLTAVCVHCGASAAFSKRLTSETEDVVLGSREKYAPTCRTCHALPATVFSRLRWADELLRSLSF